MKQLFTILLLSWFTTAVAQQSITLSVTAQPLSNVLEQLTQSYAIEFAYSTDQVDLTRNTTIILNNVSLEKALQQIFANTGIAFTINGNMVALYRDENYRVTLSGTIHEKGTGELLIGVIVGATPPKSGAISNAYGFYSISMPPGEYELHFNYIGFQPYSKKVTLNNSEELNIELTPATDLAEIVVSADVSNGLKANAFTIRLQEIKNIPMVLGERDVVKYAMLTSGVQKGNEGNSYMYVRGGGPEQNLILIDDATIYNAYHFLGLASLFSGNELRNAELIKGGFSSKYGGRLSSVLDMSMKDGNREKLSVDATVGGIASRIMIEGPIVKNKASFLVSARRSYIQKVSEWILTDDDKALDYGFYDIHAKLSTDIGNKDRLMLSGYVGKDLMQTAGEDVAVKDDGIQWGNRTASLRWSHQFSGKLFGNTSLVHSHYNSRTAMATLNGSEVSSSDAVESTINDYGIKTDIDYLPGGKHRFRFGGGYTKHFFIPITSTQTFLPDSFYEKDQSHSANEAFGYAEWGFTLNRKWNFTTGLRVSYYENEKAYFRAEPRLNAEYRLDKNWIFSSSYSMMNQYMHMISFAGLGFPNDLWVSSDQNLVPQQSQLITLGATRKNIANGLFSFTVEGYYKYMTNVVGLKENASLLKVLLEKYFGEHVDRWSDLTTQGKGRSYGIECMLRKEGKHFTGMLSYTLSRTMLQFEDLNLGDPFPATYDRTHDLGIYLNYRMTKHWRFSTNFVYGTGNAISLPVGEYYTHNSSLVGGFGSSFPQLDYEKKNSYRMKAYNRMDISIQYDHLIAKKIQSTIELSVYNVYNRANPFFYTIEQESTPTGNGKRVLKQMSLFPIMPSISWSIKI